MQIGTSFWSTLDIAAPSHSGDMGAILLASCPGLRGAGSTSDSDIKHDVEKLVAAGAGFVLSLIEAEDRARLGVTALDAIISDAGLERASFPIQDRSIPRHDQITKLDRMLDDLEARIRNGQTIAIHCQAGLGRTGMMAGILLGRFGIDCAAAIRLIRQTRPGSIETEAQEDFIRGWG